MLGGSIGCTQLFNFFSTKEIAQISQIEVKPEQNLDRSVSLQGTVSQRISFLDSGAYQLTDGTGTIWVFTKNDLPEEGEALAVKGKLRYKSIPIEDRDLGESYILEWEYVNFTSKHYFSRTSRRIESRFSSADNEKYGVRSINFSQSSM